MRQLDVPLTSQGIPGAYGRATLQSDQGSRAALARERYIQRRTAPPWEPSLVCRKNQDLTPATAAVTPNQRSARPSNMVVQIFFFF